MNDCLPILGLPVSALSLEEVLSLCRRFLEENGRRIVVTLNPELALMADRDLSFAAIVRSASLIVPDGSGITWAARRLYGRKLSRIPGIELSSTLIHHCAERGLSVFFLGGHPGMAERAAISWQKQYAALIVAGSEHGYFSPSETEALGKRIAGTRPALLLAGLGCGKQESFLAGLPADAFRLGIGVGGSLEIWAGDKRRAPAWVRSLSLEWLYRTLSEPRRFLRLWRSLPFFGRIWWKSLARSAS